MLETTRRLADPPSPEPRAVPPTRDRSRAFSATSLLGFGLAILYGLPSLPYPYGRDQGLYHYVAERWLEGGLPYVDAFDQKPPLIYATYALSHVLFGSSQAGIRALELAAVLILGALVSALWKPAILGPGASALVASLLYYSCFDYWSSAQVELWEGLFALASLVAVRRLRGPDRAALVGGALGGIAFLYKFPALFLCAAIAVLHALGWNVHGTRGRLRALLIYALAAAAVIGCALLPWIVAGEAGTLADVLIGYNLHYVRKAEAVTPPVYFLVRIAGVFTAAIGFLVLAQIARATRRRDPAAKDGLVLVGLVGLALATVVLQRKFYPYHWAILLPWATAAAVWALGLAWPGRERLALGSVAAVGIVAFALGPRWTITRWDYRRHTVHAWRATSPATFRGPLPGSLRGAGTVSLRHARDPGARARPPRQTRRHRVRDRVRARDLHGLWAALPLTLLRRVSAQ